MHYISKIAAVAALTSVATASNAPVVKGNPIGITYSATLPNTGTNSITGQCKIAASPNGEGVNIQVAFYNLPDNAGNMSYAIHTGNAGKGGDCSTVGAVLDPYGGITGPKCYTDKAACQVGDLSDKYGALIVTSGGSGTGYFAANYLDNYLSMKPGDQAFFGKGSIVVLDQTGATVTCANFVNANHAAKSSKKAAAAATRTTAASSSSASATGSGKGSSGSSSQSSSSSSGLAIRGMQPTAVPFIAAGAALAGILAI